MGKMNCLKGAFRGFRSLLSNHYKALVDVSTVIVITPAWSLNGYTCKKRGRGLFPAEKRVTG